MLILQIINKVFQVSSELVITIYSVLILVDVVEVKEVK